MPHVCFYSKKHLKYFEVHQYCILLILALPYLISENTTSVLIISFSSSLACIMTKMRFSPGMEWV